MDNANRNVLPIKVTGSEYWLNINHWLDTFGTDDADATYWYSWFTLPWTTKWRIQRIKKSDYSKAWAFWDNNGDTAWSGRTWLTYNTELI